MRERRARRHRACPRSACPTGSSGGPGSRCRRPCRRAGAACCARACWPASAAHHLATSTSDDASRPCVELPRRLQRRDPDRLGVDVRVGGTRAATPWNVDSGLPNCSRCDVYSAACSVAALAHADLDRAEPEQRAVEHRPRASLARGRVAERLGRRTPSNVRWPTSERSVVSRDLRPRPARARVDEEHAARRRRVGAGTRIASRDVRGRDRRLARRRAATPSPSAWPRTCGCSASFTPGLGERGGEERVAGDHAGQPALRAARRCRDAAIGSAPQHDRRPVRHGRDDAALLLEHEARLDRRRGRCRRASSGSAMPSRFASASAFQRSRSMRSSPASICLDPLDRRPSPGRSARRGRGPRPAPRRSEKSIVGSRAGLERRERQVVVVVAATRPRRACRS